MMKLVLLAALFLSSESLVKAQETTADFHKGDSAVMHFRLAEQYIALALLIDYYAASPRAKRVHSSIFLAHRAKALRCTDEVVIERKYPLFCLIAARLITCSGVFSDYGPCLER
jgi:hypothetical protein